MNLYLIITALSVSIDSFFCGFSLSFNSKRKIPIIFGITLTVFIMCLFTNYLTTFFDGLITEKSANLGGLILIFIGIFNLLKKEQIKEKKAKSLKLALLTGFAVGLDGAFANLSLSLMGINDFFVPLLIAFFHGVLIYFGTVCSKLVLTQKIKNISIFAPLILIGLGVYKVICSFI